MGIPSDLLPLHVAVKRGLLTRDQFQECLELQRQKEEEGIHVRLDDLAVAQGLITPEQLAALRSIALKVEDRRRGMSLEEASKIHIYEFHEKIGEGGMASVFRATHKKTGEVRAVKVLFKEHTSNPTFVERFLREGKLLKSFVCDQLAQGYEYGRVKNSNLYFMGMELLVGKSLQDMLADDGNFSEAKAIYCITQVARGLAYMQSQGVVHRDIKPDNIMWCSDGRVKLVDLGFAKPIQADGPVEYEDETCGTVQYISPEQARGLSDVDIRADIYSLGATLYHLVIGELPFTGRDSMDVMRKQVLESLDASQLKGGRVSMHMHYFIEKMMAKEREIRYQSAQEVVEDIEATLEGAADLQYDPFGTTEMDPFETLSHKAAAISGRHQAARRSAQTSIRAPLPSQTSQSARMRSTPDGKSQRMKPTGEIETLGDFGKPSASSSVRAPLPNGGNGRSSRLVATKRTKDTDRIE